MPSTFGADQLASRCGNGGDRGETQSGAKSMMSLIGLAASALFCLYSVVFRWSVVTAKYGRLELYFWFVAVTTAGTLIGYLLDVVIWTVQYASWLKSN